MKTIAVRLDDDLHARSALVAEVCGESLTEFIRIAVQERLTWKLTQSKVKTALEAQAAGLDDEMTRRRSLLDSLIRSGQ